MVLVGMVLDSGAVLTLSASILTTQQKTHNLVKKPIHQDCNASVTIPFALTVTEITPLSAVRDSPADSLSKLTDSADLKAL
jgi:hypothetical protein